MTPERPLGAHVVEDEQVHALEVLALQVAAQGGDAGRGRSG